MLIRCGSTQAQFVPCNLTNTYTYRPIYMQILRIYTFLRKQHGNTDQGEAAETEVSCRRIGGVSREM